MRRFILLLACALWPAAASAQAHNQLGPLCTTDTTPAGHQVDARRQVLWSNSSLRGEVYLAEKPCAAAVVPT